jgi:NADH:ubiquinone oxidoreductase subunit 5 (subunit L)/multisubunit Na+/H+ antiporter MnhA subunit
MCFGFTILYSFHAQDRRLVSFFFLNPVIKIAYNFACFSLIGLPFLTGFFSKDFIIEKSIEFSVEMRNIFCLLIFLAVRVYYSCKLLFLYKIIYTLVIVEFQILGI